MNFKNPIRKQYGFTLIELLVTVTIITLLCAILLPALRNAKRAANGIYCQSNLAQVARAWTMYLDANNGYFYQAMNANLTYGGWKGGGDEDTFISRPLNPFLGLPQILSDSAKAGVFRCPNDDGGVPYTDQSAFLQFGTSYQMNILVANQHRINVVSGRQKPLYEAINTLLPGMNISRAAEPARLLLVGDYGWVYRSMPGFWPVTEWHDVKHSYNLAFLDGHVKFLKIRKGLFVAPEYRVQPFEALDDLALRVQVEEP